MNNLTQQLKLAADRLDLCENLLRRTREELRQMMASQPSSSVPTTSTEGVAARRPSQPLRRGMTLLPITRDGCASVVVESHGSRIVGKVNAFAGNGTVVGDGWVLPPGYARWTIEDIGTPPDPRTATRQGRALAERHRAQLVEIGGVMIAGKPDANGPGGQGIYHESDWAVGCPAGIEDALRLAVGWANRMGTWRWDRAAYEEGRIVPHRWSAGFPGIDQTRTFPAHDYDGLVKLENYSQLDHSHLNRWTHVARIAALHGYAFGELCVRSIAEDVIACWTTPNASDDKMHKSHWWSCDGIEKFTPANIGTPHAGRQFAGALQGIGAGLLLPSLEQRDPKTYDRYRLAAKRLLSFARRVLDEERAAIYVIRYLDEAGKPSNKYKHKRQEHFGNTIPEGENPDIYKGFEHSLVYLGFRRLAAIPDFEFADVARDCAAVLARRYPENNHELEVVEHPEWSSPDPATWDDLISGMASREVVSSYLSYNAPWWSDHPLNSYTGDLR